MIDKMNSFKKQFVASMQGDTDSVIAEKSWRKAVSGFEVRILTLKGQMIVLKDNVYNAESLLQSSYINKGIEINDNNSYVNSILVAKNNLIDAQKRLKELQVTLDFCEETLNNLGSLMSENTDKSI